MCVGGDAAKGVFIDGVWGIPTPKLKCHQIWNENNSSQNHLKNIEY